MSDEQPRGADLARSALEAARQAAARRRAGTPPATRRRATGAARRGGYSGAGADQRDPQRFSVAVRRLLADRGWEQTVASAGVLARWPELVGAEIAGHSRPVSLHDSELVVQAESTAWATQLRLLAPRLLARFERELGRGLVTRLRVNGPTAPTWSGGPLRVTGRGPRDTYG